MCIYCKEDKKINQEKQQDVNEFGKQYSFIHETCECGGFIGGKDAKLLGV